MPLLKVEMIYSNKSRKVPALWSVRMKEEPVG